jgi:fructose-1,6-bisphosphatase/inositol monophosphatase family enzyme
MMQCAHDAKSNEAYTDIVVREIKYAAKENRKAREAVEHVYESLADFTPVGEADNEACAALRQDIEKYIKDPTSENIEDISRRILGFMPVDETDGRN